MYGLEKHMMVVREQHNPRNNRVPRPKSHRWMPVHWRQRRSMAQHAARAVGRQLERLGVKLQRYAAV